MVMKLVLEMKRCVKLIMTAWRGWMEREVQREADSFGESRALRHVSAPLPTRPGPIASAQHPGCARAVVRPQILLAAPESAAGDRAGERERCC